MESTYQGGASICRDVPKARKRVKKEVPVLDAPSGLRDPRAIHADKLGLVRTWCGPWVLMAVTGRPLEDIRANLNLRRGRSITAAVKGTGTYEMLSALSAFGWRAQRLPVDGKKTFAAHLRERTSEQMAEVWLVVAGNHWHLVKGRKVTCAILKRWTWISHATKRRAPVEGIHVLSMTEDASEKRKLTLSTIKEVRKTVAKRKGKSRRTYSDLTLAKREAMKEMARLAKHPTATHEKDMERITLDAPTGWVFMASGCASEYYEEPGDGSGWKAVTADIKGKSFSDLFEKDPNTGDDA